MVLCCAPDQADAVLERTDGWVLGEVTANPGFAIDGRRIEA